MKLQARFLSVRSADQAMLLFMKAIIEVKEETIGQ
jgi:hypothetical protein